MPHFQRISFYHTKCLIITIFNINCHKRRTGFIFYDYRGTVIPIEHRGDILNRNTTDGIFGIFGYDLDDLVIENIHYNRLEKLLSVCITS